jgi:hypothetical protein
VTLDDLRTILADLAELPGGLPVVGSVGRENQESEELEPVSDLGELIDAGGHSMPGYGPVFILIFETE